MDLLFSFYDTSHYCYKSYTYTCLHVAYLSDISEAEEPAVEAEKIVEGEKPSGEEEASDANKENPVNEPEEKEPEDKVVILIFPVNKFLSLFFVLFTLYSWAYLFNALGTVNIC